MNPFFLFFSIPGRIYGALGVYMTKMSAACSNYDQSYFRVFYAVSPRTRKIESYNNLHYAVYVFSFFVVRKLHDDYITTPGPGSVTGSADWYPINVPGLQPSRCMPSTHTTHHRQADILRLFNKPASHTCHTYVRTCCCTCCTRHFVPAIFLCKHLCIHITENCHSAFLSSHDVRMSCVCMCARIYDRSANVYLASPLVLLPLAVKLTVACGLLPPLLLFLSTAAAVT